MEEATCGEAATPETDWRMSAAVENVSRGEDDLAEVTSLAGAVRAWLVLDTKHREAATLTPERPVMLDGAAMEGFTGEGIAALADWLLEPSTETLKPADAAA